MEKSMKIIKKKQKRRSKKRILVLVPAIAVIALFVLPFSAMVLLYENTFGKRIYAPERISHSVEEFEGLTRTKHTFSSDKGQQIVGYLYQRDGVEYKGAAVLAHGFGSGGHRSYLAAVDFLVRNGYITFAYDVTGNDESSGKSVRGLPQGVIDLDHAITYAEGLDEFKGLPVVLFGHSWGGYSVSNVLRYHPEVKAAAVLSGFNRSTDLVESYARKMFGDFVKYLMAYEGLYERLKFGKYAANTALESFANSSMPVIVVQGSVDNIVPAEYGYDKWYKAYGDSERFEFLWVEGKGHGDVLFESGPSTGQTQQTKDQGNALLNILTSKQSSNNSSSNSSNNSSNNSSSNSLSNSLSNSSSNGSSNSSSTSSIKSPSNNSSNSSGKGLSRVNEYVGMRVIEFFDRYCAQ